MEKTLHNYEVQSQKKSVNRTESKTCPLVRSHRLHWGFPRCKLFVGSSEAIPC